VPSTDRQGVEQRLARHAAIRDPDASRCLGQGLNRLDEVLGDRLVVRVAGIHPVPDDEAVPQAHGGQHDLGIAGMAVLVVTLHPQGRFVDDPWSGTQRRSPTRIALGVVPALGQGGDLGVVLQGLEEEARRVDEEDLAIVLATHREQRVANPGFDLLGVLVQDVEGPVKVLHVPALGFGHVGVALQPVVGRPLAHGVDDAIQHQPEHQAFEVEGPDAMALRHVLQGVVEAQFTPDHRQQEAHAEGPAFEDGIVRVLKLGQARLDRLAYGVDRLEGAHPRLDAALVDRSGHGDQVFQGLGSVRLLGAQRQDEVRPDLFLGIRGPALLDVVREGQVRDGTPGRELAEALDVHGTGPPRTSIAALPPLVSPYEVPSLQHPIPPSCGHPRPGYPQKLSKTRSGVQTPAGSRIGCIGRNRSAFLGRLLATALRGLDRR